jgi:hypothetical protein
MHLITLTCSAWRTGVGLEDEKFLFNPCTLLGVLPRYKFDSPDVCGSILLTTGKELWVYETPEQVAALLRDVPPPPAGVKLS